MQYQFDTFPDCDYLPAMGLTHLGQGILACMYGSEQVIVDDNPPFTGRKAFSDLTSALAISNDFEPERTEWGRILKEQVEMFIDATDGCIPVSMPDYQSPFGTASKLLSAEDLMMGMYEEPELLHKLLDAVTDGIIKLIEAMERWAGMDLIAHNQSNATVGGCGVIIWDDYISVLNPDLHKEFCVPYNRRLFDRFGYGHLHTCGPYFPSYIEACLACSPRSFDFSIMRGMTKRKDDMLLMLDIAKKNDILLIGNLQSSDAHVFENKWHDEGEDFLELFINSGHFMPMVFGTYEEGMKLKESISAIDRRRSVQG